MSKVAEALNPTAYGLPANEPSHRSNLTEISKTNGGDKQIGWVFEDGPILNETEEMSRSEIIWQRFQIEREEMIKNKDFRHLFLLRKGIRIEGSGVDRRFRGWVIDDWLVCLKPKSNDVLI